MRPDIKIFASGSEDVSVINISFKGYCGPPAGSRLRRLFLRTNEGLVPTSWCFGLPVNS